MTTIKIKTLHPLFLVITYAICTYILYESLFYLLGFIDREKLFTYSITFLFSIFTLFSVLIIALLLLVKIKNFDSVGYAFMALTSLKIGLLLFWVRPILKSTIENTQFEKANFFIIFALFLAIETYVAIRILNNKQ